MGGPAPATVGEALAAATDAIAAAGVDTARLDAELLLARATGWDRARLVAEPELRLPVRDSRRLAEMVRRRVRREPVAYIIGRKGFRRIEVLVDRRVLIPRPETELLVDLAVEMRPRTVLDLGTGSGAIALAVADEIPEACVMAADISMDALRVAEANCGRLGLTDRVDVVSRGAASLEGAEADGRPFDLLLANLPYVSESEWEALPPEIREYEPRDALVAGKSGLEVIGELLSTVAALARRPKVIGLEIGAGQGDQVSALTRAAGYSEVEVRRDLADHDRLVMAR